MTGPERGAPSILTPPPPPRRPLSSRPTSQDTEARPSAAAHRGGPVQAIERTVAASPARVWELWTTAAGISSWWAPDGFRTEVTRLELQPGGELVYTMTAVAPEQIAFMEQYGMPLATESRKRFTE